MADDARLVHSFRATCPAAALYAWTPSTLRCVRFVGDDGEALSVTCPDCHAANVELVLLIGDVGDG